jgi:hypothetical protein
MRTAIGISFSPEEIDLIDAEVSRSKRQRPFETISRSSFVRSAVAAALPPAPAIRHRERTTTSNDHQS